MSVDHMLETLTKVQRAIEASDFYLLARPKLVGMINALRFPLMRAKTNWDETAIATFHTILGEFQAKSVDLTDELMDIAYDELCIRTREEFDAVLTN